MLVAVLLGALAQSVSGIGFALVCVPLLVAALGPQDGVRLAVLLSLVLNVVLLARLWRLVDRRRTLLLLVPSALATPLLALAVRGLPVRPAAALAGGVVLVGVALLALGVRWGPRADRRARSAPASSARRPMSSPPSRARSWRCGRPTPSGRRTRSGPACRRTSSG